MAEILAVAVHCTTVHDANNANANAKCNRMKKKILIIIIIAISTI